MSARAAARPAPSYDRLVRAAVTASLAVFGAKIVGTYVAASLSDADPSVDLVFGVVPRIAMATDPATAARIATLSTLAMGVVALGLAIWTVFGSRVSRRPAAIRLADGTEIDTPAPPAVRSDRQSIAGRCVAAVITLQTLALETIRHRRGGDAAAWPLAWVVVATGLAGIALLSAQLWNDRRRTLGGPSDEAAVDESARDRGAPT